MNAFETLTAVVAGAVLCAAGNARAQSPSDITFPLGQPTGFQVKLALSPGTQQVYCYQADRLQVVGYTTNVTTETASVPIVVPDPIIRCAACNNYGCSSLSQNAAVVTPTDPLDIDGNSTIDVRDMMMCVARIRDAIY